MARHKARNMTELKEIINNRMVEVLNYDTRLSDVIKSTEADMVDLVVYDRYRPPTPDGEPWVYERRRDDGGLSSTENMEHEVARYGDKVKMIVVNTTPGHSKFNTNNIKRGELAMLVEGGYEKFGLGKADGEYAQPRPFQEMTVKTLLENKDHVRAMKQELKAMGFTVR